MKSELSQSKTDIVILGSTGSIGKSTLDVVRSNPGRFEVLGLSCNDNIELLESQIKEFSPKHVAVGEGRSHALRSLLGKGFEQLEILEGDLAAIKLAEIPSSSILVAAMVGAVGILPVMAAIELGKTVALANKEPIVLAGCLITQAAKKYKARLLPIDSEHNAIYQSLQGSRNEDVKKVTLTASGGPFRQTPLKDFPKIQLKDALKHPNWEMGSKITIDSATMMNKCLEIIEAKWLFGLAPEQIEVLVHPQSVIHSMVTFNDASTICQMGVPDMKTPIAYCLGYPERIRSGVDWMDLAKIGSLTFEKPDPKKFPTLGFAYDVLRIGGGAPAALNGANERLVELFLEEKISFLKIITLLQRLIDQLKSLHLEGSETAFSFPTELKKIDDSIQADQWGRSFIDLQIK